MVAEALCAALRPIRARAAELSARPRLLRDVLRHGAARARERADATYEHVARLAGLLPPSARPSACARPDAGEGAHKAAGGAG